MKCDCCREKIVDNHDIVEYGDRKFCSTLCRDRYTYEKDKCKEESIVDWLRRKYPTK